jgi:hypothetical protein
MTGRDDWCGDLLQGVTEGWQVQVPVDPAELVAGSLPGRISAAHLPVAPPLDVRAGSTANADRAFDGPDDFPDGHVG